VNFGVISNAPARGATCNVRIFRLSQTAAGEVERTPEPTAKFYVPANDAKKYCDLLKK
jgi:hypothetical protein